MAEVLGRPRSRRHTARSVRAAIRVVLISSLVAVVLLIGLLAVAVPAITGSRTYTILTSSMKPDLPPGTFVVVERRAATDLRVGDIITYQLSSGQPDVVTHRIVKVMVDSNASRTFLTRGDNNGVADSKPVHPAQIRGKVWYAIPFVGWIAGLRSTGVGRIAVYVIGSALVVYGAFVVLFAIRRSLARNRGKRRATFTPTRPASTREAESAGQEP